MKRIRILHVTKAFFPAIGGIEQVVSQIAGGLKQNVSSYILTTRGFFEKSKETINGVFVRRTLSLCTLFSMPLPLLYPFWFWYYARKVDIVDYHYPFPLIDLLITLYFPKKTQLVIHWHAEIVAQKKLARLLSPFLRYTLKRANKIVVASSAYTQYSEKLTPFADKCEIIPYGIDIDFWKNVNTNEKEKIRNIQQQYGQFILAVGRLVPYKGFDVLLKSITPGMKLVIIGAGPLEKNLKKMMQDLQLSAQVFFLGKLPDDELKCYFHACYLFAFPSVTENEAFGMVQLEAMACAKPIVNTLLHSAVTFVARPGKEAISVKPGSPSALNHAFLQLFNDDALATSLGSNGFVRVNQEFSNQAFCDKTYALYQHVSENGAQH